MRRALKRAARLLVAAGALGLSQAALAQAPPAAAARAPSAGQAHLERMKVELAWMTDPATFNQPLEAHVRGGSLEIRGTLADADLKEHALRVARQNSFLPVVDGLTVAGAAQAPQASAPDALTGAARKLLVRHLGPRAASFEVAAQPDGLVSVGGTVSSVEEKLAASRCLRELSGCKGVVNRLAVAPVSRDGKAVTLVSRDGAHAVLGPLQPTAAAPAVVVTGDEVDAPLPRVRPVASEQVAPAAPTYTLPSGLPPARAAVKPAEWPTAPAGYATPAGPTAAPHTASLCPACAQRARHAGAAPAEGPSLWERLSARMTAARQSVASAISPSPPAAPAPKSVTAWPPPQDVRPAGAAQAHLTPVSAPAAKPTTTPAAGPAAPVSAVQLHRAIEAACGKLARKVQVMAHPDRTLRVRVEVASPEAEREVTERVLPLPEMAAPNVRLEIVVGS